AEDAIEHRPRGPSRERVLLARVIRIEEQQTVRKTMARGVCEAWQWARDLAISRLVRGKEARMRDLSQCDDDPDAAQQLQLVPETRTAARHLRRGGLVRRRRTAGGGRHVRIVQPEAVTAPLRRRLAREAGIVERAKQPSPALVTGEDAAGAVAAV